MLLLALLIFMGVIQAAYPTSLSEEQQLDILDRLRYLRGEGPLPASMEGVDLPHCGTDIVFSAFINRRNFTGKLAADLDALAGRPSGLNSIYLSAAGHFRIHYTIEGPNSVYQVDIDTLGGGDLIPDYVNHIALIADSVWALEVNALGFPAPPSDGTMGGDSLKDIYILNLGPSYYGYTEPETALTTQSVTSFLVIDNDYNIYPYNDSDAMNRRLDAARVTLAHEFFHTIHYAMDYTEYQEYDGLAALYWWEMSAVWMEEMAYDNINDYYAYLLYFFNAPWYSLQDVSIRDQGLHQYASMIFPLFLSEKFGTGVIRAIWEKCRDLGVGPQFHTAVDEVIDSVTAGEYNLVSLLNEFAVWNVFTGSRRSRAPAGIGYSEGAQYPRFIDSMFLTFNEYIDTLIWFQPDGWRTDTLLDGSNISRFKNHMPQNLSAHYIDLRQISQIADDSLYVYFLGTRDTTYHISWAITFLGFPVSGVGPAAVIEKFLPAELQAARFNTQTASYSNIIGVATPVTTSVNSYPKKYGYTLIFNDSISPPDVDFITNFLAYPNPMRVDSPDDSVTFRVSVETSERLDAPAILKVTIFNVAGEKVIRLPDVAGESGDYISNLFSAWYLDNESGKKVASGVYLAYLELAFQDGHPSINKKLKIAVIK
nr:hypothetical protein [candidate division Zixibacteria bacterium]